MKLFSTFVKSLLSVLFCILILPNSLKSYQESGDSIIVQAFEYTDSTFRTGTFEFPPLGESYRKVLMEYSLKCWPWDKFDVTNNGQVVRKIACGEWDYTTKTFVTDSSGTSDSTLVSNKSMIIMGDGSKTFSYSNNPIYKNYVVKQDYKVINSVENEKSSLITSSEKEDVNFINNKFQFIINRDEISSDISEIKAIELDIKSASGMLKNLTIKIGNTKDSDFKSEFSSSSSDMQTYLMRDFTPGSGLNKFALDNSFELTGDNVLVEISHDSDPNDVNIVFNGHSNTFQSFVSAGGSNFSMEFNRRNQIDVPKEVFSTIEDEITIELWQFGGDSQPIASSIFEGRNSKNERIINSHLPWNNGKIYWDCGSPSQRIEKVAEEKDYKGITGGWNHWVFTKNANNGVMKIYLNGKLFQSGTGKNTKILDIANFVIGSSGTRSNFYEGKVDDFLVWDTELSTSEIAERFASKTALLESKSQNLRVRYNFDEGSGDIAKDLSGNGFDGALLGDPQFARQKAEDIYHSFVTSDKRPDVNIYDGDYDLSTEEFISIYKELVPSNLVYIYDYESKTYIIPALELEDHIELMNTPTSTLSAWKTNGWEYTFNGNDEKIDSSEINIDGTLELRNIDWYNPVVKYEIFRFITPYGIGLDMEDGYTWTADVTDYQSILHDWVKISAGNYQEMLDIKFIFLKGTPARDVKSMSTLWKQQNAKYPNVVENTHLAPVEKLLPADASEFRVITRSSGHRFGGNNTDNCAEFCQRLHSVWVNDNKEYEWLAWKECGDNELFPQGGTWLTDRTDWCPGAPVTTYNHEITDFVTAGEIAKIDYEIEEKTQFTTEGDWQMTGHLVSYGEANFTRNAELLDILSPSVKTEYKRFNPVCNNPKILIKNSGSEELTNIKIVYGIKGFGQSEFLWEGSLPYLEETIVDLPSFDWGSGWEKAEEYIFEVNLIESNGETDEYAGDSGGESIFEKTDALGREVIIELITNNFAQFGGVVSPFRYRVKNEMGEFLRNVDANKASTRYLDTLTLGSGCYEFYLDAVIPSGQYKGEAFGLDYWAISSLTSGSLKIKSGNITKTFNPDFGNFVQFSFMVEEQPELIADQTEIDFGNVSKGDESFRTLKITPKNDKGLIVYEASSQNGSFKGFEVSSSNPEIISSGTSLDYGDTMSVEIKLNAKSDGLIKDRLIIKSNDNYKPTAFVDLAANQDTIAIVNEEIIDFGIVANGNSKSKELIVYPGNSLGLKIYEIEVLDAENSGFEFVTSDPILSAEGTEINFGDSMIVEIELNSTSFKFQKDTIRIRTNADENDGVIDVIVAANIPTGINNENSPLSLNINGNPLTNSSLITFATGFPGVINSSLELFSTDGKLASVLFQEQINDKMQQIRISKNDFATGLYLLRFTAGNYTRTVSLVIE
jgi:Concanavalin A-like lectin/glucanases superfamily/Peptide-N-glycosidase F, C terminal